MSPLNSSNVDSQGIKFELNDSNKTAKIIGYENLSTSNVIIKRGVENTTNGVIYKVTSMTSDCLTNATSIKSMTFDKTKLDEFQYEMSGFPSSLTEVQFKDQVLPLKLSFNKLSFTKIGANTIATDGNGRYICGSDRTSEIHFSNDDGLTWTKSSTLGFTSSRDATYGNGTFIIVGDYRPIYSSTDMNTWINRGNSKRWNTCAYGNNIYVCGTHADSGIQYSSDLNTFTSSNISSSMTSCRKIIFGNNEFVAIVNQVLYKSTNGSYWTKVKTIPGSSSEALCYGGGYYIICSNESILVSNNLSTWYEHMGGRNWIACAYGNNKWIIINNNGEVYESSDCSTFSLSYKVAPGNYIYTKFGKNHFLIVDGNGEFYISN